MTRTSYKLKKLGAYPMEFTLELFEENGYVELKDLDNFFRESYCEFETDLTLEEFVEKSKYNILRSLKYREFIDGEVKFCSKCKHLKPLSSFQNMNYSVDKKQYSCKHCRSLYYKEYRKNNKEKISKRQKEYKKNNKDKQYSYEKKYIQNNRDKSRKKSARHSLRNYLRREGIEIPDLVTLNCIVNFKYKQNIRGWGVAYNEYRKINN